MRFVRIALAAAGRIFELTRIKRAVALVATVLATMVAVLLVAFVAVAVGLS